LRPSSSAHASGARSCVHAWSHRHLGDCWLDRGSHCPVTCAGKAGPVHPGGIGIGIVGSFVGGFLGYFLFGHDRYQGFFQPSGLFGSIIGAVIVLLVWLRVTQRSGSRNRR